MSRARIPEPVHPWERRPGETEAQWTAFLAYREQARPRSVRRLAREMGKKESSTYRGYSSLLEWQTRVAAYDADQDRARAEGARQEGFEAGRRQAQAAAALQAGLIQPAQELLRRIQAERAAGRNPFEGWTVEMLVKTTAACARAFPAIATFERLSRGMSTSNVAGHDGGAIQHDVADARERAAAMTRQELEAYLLGVTDAGEASVQLPLGESAGND